MTVVGLWTGDVVGVLPVRSPSMEIERNLLAAPQAAHQRVEVYSGVARLAKTYPFDYAIHFPNRLEQPPEVVEAAIELYRSMQMPLWLPHAEVEVARADRLAGLKV